jgi:WD40 repeat protein
VCAFLLKLRALSFPFFRIAIVMSLQMIKGFTEDTVRVLAGYEDGFVKMWKVEKGGSASLEWSQRRHTESGEAKVWKRLLFTRSERIDTDKICYSSYLVMAIALSKDNTFAISVAADRQVVRYEVGQEGSVSRSVLSNSSGHACVAIQEDGETIAVGGWDGWYVPICCSPKSQSHSDIYKSSPAFAYTMPKLINLAVYAITRTLFRLSPLFNPEI